jgi:hypothetical protein
MKCPFCVADNPSHANFCMNCGSPQDLKACEECGGISKASAPHCQMCGAPFSESAVAKLAAAPSPSPPSDHAAEVDALASETQTFKQLFAELEKDVAQQLTTPKPAPTVAKVPAPLAEKERKLYAIIGVASAKVPVPPPNVQAALGPDAIITVDPPAYLQQMLSERMAKSDRASRRAQRVLIAIFVISIVAYCFQTIGARHRPQIPSTPPPAAQTNNPPTAVQPMPATKGQPGDATTQSTSTAEGGSSK